MVEEPLTQRFDRRSHPDAAARCAAWREAFSLSVDTVFASGEIESFEASACFRSLGPVLLTDTAYTAHTVVRDRRTLARTGSEQVILDLFVDGGFTGSVGGQACAVAPGDCFVMDMRDTFRVRLKPGRFVGLIMPRALFEHAVGTDVSMHGLVLPAGSAPAHVLGALLGSVASRMRDLSPELAGALGPALVATAGACLRDAVGAPRQVPAHLAREPSRRRPAEPTLARMSRHIHRHAADPLYDADTLGRAYGLSRSALYRLYQPSGGIAAAIRRRRAALALRLLTDGEARSLSSVSQASGFGNERALRRALRVVYGATPGVLRRTGKVADGERPDLAIGALFDALPR